MVLGQLQIVRSVRLWSLLLALILCINPDASAGEKPRPTPPGLKKSPNILWIVAENIDLDLGCYGAKHVKTPNLDRLAQNGVSLHACLCHVSRVCSEPIGLHDRHVSNDDRHASHAFPPRRQLPLAPRRSHR